jgi:hypothetical protein
MGLKGLKRICLLPAQQLDAEQMLPLTRQIRDSIFIFGELGTGLRLRGYQRAVAQAIVDSVVNQSGLSFVVMFPRQSGKNELQAHIEAYLLFLHQTVDGEIVKVSPTWKPQSLNAMRRIERILKRNLVINHHKESWSKESGYIYRIGSARIYFLSGSPTANIVGATANILLECDEAQDVSIEKWDKEIAPMAASTNATRVFWGTAWTSKTLLARELRAARKAEQQDGIRRTFVLSANDVMIEVPAYGKFVQEQIAKLGRNHPMVKTQYFSEEIDAEGGMFPRSRQVLMQGRHERCDSPPFREGLGVGGLYAFTIDVAGEDEGASDDPTQLENPKRDSTTLTIFEVDLSTLDDEIIAAPTYKVMQRLEWIGEKHSNLYARIKALVDLWEPKTIAIDSTGVGAGLASFFVNAYGDRVIPFLFTIKSKSDLGWSFLAVVETGRYKEYRSEAKIPSDFTRDCSSETDELHSTFWSQVEACQMNIKEGPNKIIHWGVPDGTRDPVTGDLIHDDLLISAAMCSLLDGLEWHITFTPMVLQARDPLADIDKEKF